MDLGSKLRDLEREITQLLDQYSFSALVGSTAGKVLSDKILQYYGLGQLMRNHDVVSRRVLLMLMWLEGHGYNVIPFERTR